MSAGAAQAQPAPVARQAGVGCWARLYDTKHFGGDALSLVGPLSIRDVNVTDLELGRHYDSLAVGPRARLYLFSDQGFRGAAGSFEPGQRVADLDDRLGYFEKVRSLHVVCTS